jgi:hypothetical protein
MFAYMWHLHFDIPPEDRKDEIDVYPNIDKEAQTSAHIRGQPTIDQLRLRGAVQASTGNKVALNTTCATCQDVTRMCFTERGRGRFC